MSSGDYAFHSAPVDLSLNGSQVSPTRKPNSARSNVSNKSMTSARSQKSSTKASVSKSSRSANTKSRKGHNAPSLAMSFPSKENRRPQQTNISHSTTSSIDDPLASFFRQPTKQSNTTASKVHNPPSKLRASKNHMEERVFEIPQTACSDISSASYGSKSSSRTPRINDNAHDSSNQDIDYLKSYLSNVEKYTDPQDELRFSDLEDTPRNSDARHPGGGDMQTDVIVPANSKCYSLEDEKNQRDIAARKIQVFYRRHSIRRKMSKAAVKRMLSTKREEIEKHQAALRGSQRSEEEKRLQRKQKQREAHQRAAKELLAAKRQEQEFKRVINEELASARIKLEAEKRKQLRRKSEREEAKKRGSPSSHVDSTPNDVIHQDITAPALTEEINFTSADGPTPHTVQRSATTSASDVEAQLAKSHTTLDDILATIRVLEEEPGQLKQTSKSALDEKLAYIDDLQSDSHSVFSKSSHHSLAQPDANQVLAEAKLKTLIDWTQVEEKAKKTQNPSAEDSSTASTQQIIEAERTATEVTSKMLKLQLDLEEKTKSVSLLHKALSQQREFTLKQLEEQEKEKNRCLKIQKEQYETTVQRHLSFIDQLIADKQDLNDKCEKLVRELKQSDEKYQSKIKHMGESHQHELKKSREVMAAAEKLRREKWIDEKTKKIKDMTVKGLEPELQRLLLKHKEEVKKLKAIHEAELLRSDERAGQRYIRQNEELRNQLEKEKEAACTREREMARSRYEKQIEHEELALQQQRKRMFDEVAEEKERIAQHAARQRSELEKLKVTLEENNRISSSSIREEYEKNMVESSRRHAHEMQALKERLELEKEAWQENYRKKQETYIIQKERELKESVRRDRDKEIDLAIHRLEDDMHQQRQEQDKTTENRLKRIRDKYEAEMKEVERSEKQTQEKYAAIKVQFNEMESSSLNLESLVKQKEQEVKDTTKIKDKLVEERSKVSDVIRQEFADRLVITEEENKRIKNELSELRARQRFELERITSEKEEELAQVHQRVKQAIVKKEETMRQVRLQHEDACRENEHLKALLETQRKQILGAKKK